MECTQNLLPSKRKLGEEDQTSVAPFSKPGFSPRMETTHPSSSKRRIILSTDRSQAVLTSRKLNADAADGGGDKLQTQADNDAADCLLQLGEIMDGDRPANAIQTPPVATEGGDKENSDPNSCPKELVVTGSHQHGRNHHGPPPGASPLIVRSSPQGNIIGNHHHQEEAIIMDPRMLVVSQTSSSSKSKNGTLEMMLAATNLELRQTNGQYEQFMIDQENQIRGLQTKLEQQAEDHSKALKQKDEDVRQMLIAKSNESQQEIVKLRQEKDVQLAEIKQELADTRSKLEKQAEDHSKTLKQKDEDVRQMLIAKSNESQQEIVKLRQEKDVQLDQVKQELADTRSENEKSQQIMSSEIKSLTQKKKSLKAENCNLKTEISALQNVNEQSQHILAETKRESEAKLSAIQQELADTRSENSKLKTNISQLEDYCGRMRHFNASSESEMKLLNQRLKSSERVTEEFRQKFENAKAHHESSMGTMRTMWQNALQQQRSFSSQNQQLCRNQQEQEGVISGLQTRLEEMEEEMEQMKMNHAMEIGFHNGV